MPAFVTQFWHLRSGFGGHFRFRKFNKNKSSEGKSMKQNSNLKHFQQLFFCLTKKNGKGRQDRSSCAKTGLQRRAGATT